MKNSTGGKLDEMLAYAKEIGDESLEECIKRLEGIDENTNCETVLMADFAPRSLYFERYNKETGEFRGNGGVIFHGSHDGGGNGGAPTFSVSLGGNTNARWEIHT